MTERHYLELLSKEYPNADAVSAEIINLSAIVRLPKGTEYFFSDIHGEADAFAYLLGTASGVIGAKIEALFHNSVPAEERQKLSALIYDPETALLEENCLDHDWCRVVMFRLIQVCKTVASKYTRSKVRKKMPPQFGYVLDELLHADTEENKEEYFNAIINAIIDTGAAHTFIVALCKLIRRCAIDKLHILGDIFDRGPHADLVMEELMMYDADIQWGNHDIHWMGAAAGNSACVANVVRLATSYNNFDLLEDSYGINLRPLSAFAAEVYKDDECAAFRPHLLDSNEFDPVDETLAAKMHKAIAIIQFKLEGALLQRHPEYGMAGRALLAAVDFAKGEVEVDGKRYPLRDTSFPTVDPADPLQLTPAEEELVHSLTRSFTHSPTLQRHIQFLYDHGSMYRIANGNLLYHGCIPLDDEGNFKTITLDGEALSGRAYLDAIDRKIRNAYYAPGSSAVRQDAGDFLWYLWCGADSPIFGKSRLTTFERYFIEDESVYHEEYNPYYLFSRGKATAEMILLEFGLDPQTGHIVNGHVPVRNQNGESPIKAGGRLFVIDGGISKAYHGKTGIGGYTLISNSHYLALAEHRPFDEVKLRGLCEAPKVEVVERYPNRVMVRDTDTGVYLRLRIQELQDLLAAYRDGTLPQNLRNNA